jgi:hypothetical protein
MDRARKLANFKAGIYRWGCACCVGKSKDLVSHQSAKTKTEWRKLTHRLERRIRKRETFRLINEYYEEFA